MNKKSQKSHFDTTTPWVWFDVDDVLVDTSVLLQQSLYLATGKYIAMESWPSHNFSQVYGFEPDQMHLIRQYWQDHQVLEKAEPYANSVKAVQLVEQKGYNVGLITARGWHPQGGQITQQMAQDYKMPISSIILAKFEDSKVELLQKTGTHVAGFLDDTIRHVEGCLGAGMNAKLMRRPWNQHADHLPHTSCALDFAQSLPLAKDVLLHASNQRTNGVSGVSAENSGVSTRKMKR